MMSDILFHVGHRSCKEPKKQTQTNRDKSISSKVYYELIQRTISPARCQSTNFFAFRANVKKPECSLYIKETHFLRSHFILVTSQRPFPPNINQIKYKFGDSVLILNPFALLAFQAVGSNLLIIPLKGS